MTRKFSKREFVLLCVLGLILLAGVYYMLFAQPMMNRRTAAEAQVVAIQDEMMIETVRLQNMKKMQTRIDEIDAKKTFDAKIPAYDNFERVMKQLHAILGGTGEYDLNFGEPTEEGTMVYRPVDVKFTVANYAVARNLINQINECQYKCVIDTVGGKLKDTEGGSISRSAVEVEMSVIFIETTAKE